MMDLTKFSAFKYRHAGRGGISRRRWQVLGAMLLASLLATLLAFPEGALAILVPLFITLSAPKMLYVGPRYLICGDTIVYFNNVVSVDLDRAAGKLKLVAPGGRAFVLDRERFPTNARKAHKVAANRAAKFGKASAKLVDRVLKASPDAELHGISRGDLSTA